MTNNVKIFPRRFQFKRTVNGKEVWAQPAPSDNFIWEICASTQGDRGVGPGKCFHCPKSEICEIEGDEIVRGCRVRAEHVCRVAMAMIAKEQEYD